MEVAILKINLEKAYDHVDWKLVDYMFHRLGCGTNWRGLTGFGSHLPHSQFWLTVSLLGCPKHLGGLKVIHCFLSSLPLW